MRTTQQQARYAGFLYLALAVSAPFGLLYVPGKLIVSGDATATAERLRASESLLRWGIFSELLHQTIVVFLVLALYRLFESVSRTLAVQIVVFGALLSVPVMFANVLNNLAALTLVSGADFLSVFPKEQLDALAYFFVRLHGQGITVTSIFWGIWLFPFGLVAIRSRFIPALFGWLLLVAGTAYVVTAFFILVLPEYRQPVSAVGQILEIAEVPIIFWLAIRGARPVPAG